MSNPTLTRDQAVAMLQQRGCTAKVAWIGLRDPNSKYGENDAYTDTAGLLTPDGYTEFKFNTLPTTWLAGIACLQPGSYRWKKGLHGIHHLNLAVAADKEAYGWLLAHVGQDHPDPNYRLTYWAFREVPPMTVIRNGQAGTETDSADNPYYIDGHHGGANTTSSAACQTWPIPDWHAVRTAGYGAMDQEGQEEIPYELFLMD